jgi:glycosyltransferase involved in cell wall biosynthesis
MLQAKKNIVLITTWFPPAIGVAVNRMSAFAKYLSHEKYDLTVLTLGETDSIIDEEYFNSKVRRFSNPQILKSPKFNSGDSRVKHKLKTAWNILVLKYNSDVYKGWRKKVEHELDRMHSVQKIDLIISSFSPESAHLAALNFCKVHANVKWIADMRDEMSQNPTISGKLRKRLLKIESEINTFASCITTVSQPLVELFRKTTCKSVSDIVEIRNGFDHDIPILDQPFNDVLTFTYCGKFYGAYKPDLFFKALVRIFEDGNLPEKIKLVFVGCSKNFDIPQIFEKFVTFENQTTPERSIDFMAKSDVNLLLIPADGRTGVFTGKLFDYVSVNVPVFAILDLNDVAAELLSQTGHGYLASNDDFEGIVSKLQEVINDWQQRKKIKIAHDIVTMSHRKYQVEKLNKIIHNLLNEN